MTELRFSFPLIWPTGRAVTPLSSKVQPKDFKSDASFMEAITFLRDELRDMEAPWATLHTNFHEVDNDHARKKDGASNGASLHLTINSRSYLIACDKWMLGQHNIYALHLVLHHLQQLEKWGIESLPVLFQGFLANAGETKSGNVQISGKEFWLTDLGLGTTATLADANATYRVRAKAIGENQEGLMQLNAAIDMARKNLA